ncbi:MAG TPA: ISL3 family transposase [Bryobacteraceae bacterium]|nr:ISL3 family transposase [Bryobacteraceae bacterium]
MAASTSPLPVLLPDPSRLTLDNVVHQDGVILIIVSVTTDAAACPLCGFRSCHVHSRYRRTLQDLPCQGPTVTSPYGRQTGRHRDALLSIGYALGGEAGFRLAAQLGIGSSADTILRIVKQNACPESDQDVRVLGVDDWAWRRGHRYGTVLVDLERHRPIDLLPDRESKTLEQWLRTHPKIEVISRDRAGAYAEGARKGAPAALQVADRFHIFCNLTQALQRLLERLAGALRKVHLADPASASVAPSGISCADPANAATAATTTAMHPAPLIKLNLHQQQSQELRERRKARYEAVIAAHQRGLTKRAIARELGLSRRTVMRFLRADTFPERAPRQRRSGLDLFRDYLEKRWTEGCHNAAQLCRELQQQGYTGQRSRVKEYLQSWRVKPPRQSPESRKLPNLRLIAFWLTKPTVQRKPEEQQWVQAVTDGHPEVATAEQLAQGFRQLFKDHAAEGLDAWLQRSQASGIRELMGFVTGIRRDHAAVVAGIEQHWSNGQVEGQVHRLKLLKRQMYGRCGFLLLRRRVLPFAGQPQHKAPRSP